MSVDELKRLDTFTKLYPPHFSGTPSEDIQDLLDHCHDILHNIRIVEPSGVDFIVFLMHAYAKRWWQVYEQAG